MCPSRFLPLLAAALLYGCGGSGDTSGLFDSGGVDAPGAVDANLADGSSRVDSGNAVDAGRDAPAPPDANGTDASGDAATGDAATGDAATGDAATDAGATDGGDGGRVLLPHAGMATVPGGVKAQSASYKMITTTGQSPGGNGSLSSPGYRMNGGVVGATQGP
jgi:hypothetical protein